MVAGFRLATTGEKGAFNVLSVEDKKAFIKEHGWFRVGWSENSSPGHDAVAHFKVSRYISNKLEIQQEYFEWWLRPTPEGDNLPALPLYIYYDQEGGGVKMRTEEWSLNSKEPEVKTYDLNIDEPIEFSSRKYVMFHEKYKVVLINVNYGDMNVL